MQSDKATATNQSKNTSNLQKPKTNSSSIAIDGRASSTPSGWKSCPMITAKNLGLRMQFYKKVIGTCMTSRDARTTRATYGKLVKLSASYEWNRDWNHDHKPDFQIDS